MVAPRFSRAQLGTLLGCLEGFSGWLLKLLVDCKPLMDEGLELVPGEGIEPPTRGFSIPFCLISATARSEITSCKIRTHQRFQPCLIFVHGVHGAPDIPRNYPRCTHKPCTHLAQAWPGKVGRENRHAPGGSSHVPQPDRNPLLTLIRRQSFSREWVSSQDSARDPKMEIFYRS